MRHYSLWIFLLKKNTLTFRKNTKDNRYLDDEDPKKFIAKMGAEALIELLKRLDLDKLSFDLRHKANNETLTTKKGRSTEASSSY